MSDREGRPTRVPPAVREYLRYSGIGLTMAVYVVAFTLLGRWVDGLLGWRVPVCTIVGVLLGLAGAMMHLFKATRKR